MPDLSGFQAKLECLDSLVRAAERVRAAFEALDRQALEAVSKRSAEGFFDVLKALDETAKR